MQEQKQKKITTKRLENIALYYLSRYDSSSFNLREVLRRRVLKEKQKGAEADFATDSTIEAIIDKMQSFGYLDDTRYTENQIRKLKAQGKSRTFIKAKLQAEGVNADLSGYDDKEAAKVFVTKNRLGQDKDKYEKELAKMARAGFSYSDSVKALRG